NWPKIKNSIINGRGSATLLCIFIFILLATLGVGSLINTQVFLQTNHYRRSKWLQNQAAENGVKWGISSLRRYFDKIYPFLFLGEDNALTDFGQAKTFPPDRLEDLLGPFSLPPDDQNFHLFSWETNISSSLNSFYKNQHYWLADYDLLVEGKGYRPDSQSFSSASLIINAQLGCGRLPLAWFPFLYEGEPSSREKKEIEEKINIFSRETSIFKPRKITLPSDKLNSTDPQRWLAENLKVGALEPEDFSQRRFREILGLEPSAESIPPGVYLIRDDLGLGGLFIQGDVEEILLGIESSFQVIQIKKEAAFWQLRFSPANQITKFQTPAGEEIFDYLPRGMVIINGSVKSLAAGVIDSRESLRPTREKVPCLLQGITLTFLCSEEITITSHLYQEGLRLEKEIPYLKGQEAQLVIWASGKDLLTGDKAEGRIQVQTKGNNELLIQAHLTTSSLNVQNDSSEANNLRLVGSLQTTQLNLTNIFLDIFHQPPLEKGFPGEPFPLTKKPILALLVLQPIEWSEGNYE
ncbi:hypothetical protein NLC35_03800, partial [Candidatus Aminicenantes bacterium AC-334-K16]|nr:hypothetical protein [Candidatus Aminicenantes bacterium AC-334-K16]